MHEFQRYPRPTHHVPVSRVPISPMQYTACKDGKEIMVMHASGYYAVSMPCSQ